MTHSALPRCPPATNAGSGYRNPASRPRKSCGTWTKRTQHSSAPSPLINGVCLPLHADRLIKYPEILDPVPLNAEGL